MKIAGGYKNIRLKNYDYHDGWFFITNKTNFSQPLLVGECYDIVKKNLQELSRKFEGVMLDIFTIVPTHVHCILIFNEAVFPLNEVWRQFKAKSTFEAKKKGLTTTSLWQKNYFEHVIRNEKALGRIRQYILNNPLKEKLPLDEIYEGY